MTGWGLGYTRGKSNSERNAVVLLHGYGSDMD